MKKLVLPITDVSIFHHIAILLLLLWVLNAFDYGHPVIYFISLVYLYQVHQRYIMRLTRKVQFEERRSANQRRVLSDSETVRWLNHAVEKIWPICLEDIVSQKIFLLIIPWFLEKYKPWTVKRAAVQHLYLGRNPPMFTEMRVLHESSDDDHLVLELGMSFLTADDMSAILAAKLRKRVGFGIVAKMHLTSLHVEGKILVGVKFISKWPYIGRLRISFSEPPYFQMTVKPMFNHGVDVTELPGVAGWLDNLLAMAFEQTLVEPNMLVVDMEKFVSPEQENWFSVVVKEPVAFAKVEVIEASDMKPSDPNGFADPYVKGQLGPYRFRTRILKKTLDPKWQEEFKVPLCSWESDTVLNIEVCDKDPLVDDGLGVCSVDFSNLRDGRRHDMWLNLGNVKMGRLHLAITVIEANPKVNGMKPKDKESNAESKVGAPLSETRDKGSFPSGKSKQSQRVADTFEAIDFEGQKDTGIWVHRPGSEAPHIWEPRKGRSRQRSDTEIQREDEDDDATSSPKSTRGSRRHDSSNEHAEGDHASRKPNILRKGLHKINTTLALRRSNLGEPLPSPSADTKSVDSLANSEDSGNENSTKMKDMAKSIFKHAGKSARHLKFALSGKGSKRFKRRTEEEAEENKINEGDDTDSSDEDSQLSSVDGLVIPANAELAGGPVHYRDRVPVAARDPVAAVSYCAPLSPENKVASPRLTVKKPSPLKPSEGLVQEAR